MSALAAVTVPVAAVAPTTIDVVNDIIADLSAMELDSNDRVDTLTLTKTAKTAADVVVVVAAEDEPNNCPICFDTLTCVNTVPIHGCGHEFCRGCVNTLNIRSNMFDNEGLGIKIIKCPMCRGLEQVSSDKLKLKVRELNSQKNTLTFEVTNLRYEHKMMQNTLLKMSKDLRKALPKKRGMPRTDADGVVGAAGAADFVAAARAEGVTAAAAAGATVAPTPNGFGFGMNAQRPSFLHPGIAAQRPSFLHAGIAATNPFATVRNPFDAGAVNAAAAVTSPAAVEYRAVIRNHNPLAMCCVQGCRAAYRTRGKCAGNCGRSCCSRCKKCADCRTRR